MDGYVDLVEIGRGGFGVVYRAWQPALNRHVAIKVLSSSLDASATERFAREGLALGSLTGHPNVVAVLHVGVFGDGRPFIVMPYLPAGSLAQQLAAKGPLPWTEVAALGIRLAGAVETAHRAGVVHRDVKPENVLLSGYGEPQLADFGIARISGGFETKSQHVTASLAHAAPETLDGAPPGPMSDLYSLGSTLFTLSSGRPAFVRGGDEALVALYLRIARNPIPDLRPTGAPDGLCLAIERAMAKDPAARQPSVEAFGNELQNVQRAEGAAVVTPMVVGSTSRAIGVDSVGSTAPSILTEPLSTLRSAPSSDTASCRTIVETATDETGRRGEALAGREADGATIHRRRSKKLIGSVVGVCLVAAVAGVLLARAVSPSGPAFLCVGTRVRCGSASGVRTVLRLAVDSPVPPKALVGDGNQQATMLVRLTNIGKSDANTSGVELLIRGPEGLTLIPGAAPTDFGDLWTCRPDAVKAGLSLRCTLRPRPGDPTVTFGPGEDESLRFDLTASRPGRLVLRANVVTADFRPVDASGLSAKASLAVVSSAGA